jgi:hypothetical protein
MNSSNKVWTLKEQAEYLYVNRPVLPVGAFVTPITGTYLGDKDRIGLHAEIIGVETTEICENHVASEKFGCTHEERYRVRYEDGQESVLWLEECSVLLTPKQRGA